MEKKNKVVAYIQKGDGTYVCYKCDFTALKDIDMDTHYAAMPDHQLPVTKYCAY